jgi:V/A-type H+-transporting ATPase subunit E
MDEKIQALTNKIYHEGVEKGQEEANRLISEAKTQAK